MSDAPETSLPAPAVEIAAPVAPVAAPPPPAASAAPAPAAVAPPPAPPPAADPRVDALMTVLSETVAQDLGALPANVAATVRAIAPDSDPVAQRRALNAIRANGLATPPPAAPAPLAPPASTVVSMPAPSITTPAADDAAILARFERLRATAPLLASTFESANRDAITRATAARGTN